MTPASDVFSYGGILWELLTQEIPFEGLSAYQISMLIKNDVKVSRNAKERNYCEINCGK